MAQRPTATWQSAASTRARSSRHQVAARIPSAVDVMDAMLSERPHRGSIPVHDAIAHLQLRRGALFDPQLVDAITAHLAQIVAI